jgi:hypothetical protein
MGIAAAVKQYDRLCNSENRKSQRYKEIHRGSSTYGTRMAPSFYNI